LRAGADHTIFRGARHADKEVEDVTRTPLSRAALEPALQPLADAALAASDGMLARVWLTGPGDLCATCVQRDRCPDRTRCLHLVASSGLTTRLDGPFRRYPIGSTEVGRVPLTRASYHAGGTPAELAARGLADPTWLAHHGVRGFVAVPLEYGGHAIGVVAVFTRAEPSESARRALTHIAGLGAVALGSLRAYRELASDRNRVAARALRTPRGEPAADPLRPLAESERRIIEDVLRHTRGRVSGPRGAAAILRMKPTTLFSRLKKLGIDRRGTATRHA
jgi:transcriptional regulator with GAF, ATPase, and Fis domain